jgi:hypothetical protein
VWVSSRKIPKCIRIPQASLFVVFHNIGILVFLCIA